MESSNIWSGLAVIVWLVGAVGCAYRLEQRRRSLPEPEMALARYIPENTFYWGYWLGCTQAFVSGLFLIALMISLLTGRESVGEDGFPLLIVVLFVVFVLVNGVQTCRLNRWAFIICSVLSLNPLIWIVNIVYGYKRWNWRNSSAPSDQLNS